MNNNLNYYQLKLTTLTPVHIGTGEVYEPTEFVIENERLYLFDEMHFYRELSVDDKKSFDQKIESADWKNIMLFYQGASSLKLAKKISHFNCKVTREIQEKYNDVLTGDETKFLIEKTYKNPNTHRPVIPGSSFKGMIETALAIYSSPEKSNNATRQKLLVTDAALMDGGVEIGVTNRVHKNPDRTAESPIPQKIEIIQTGSAFMLEIKTEYLLEDIQTMLKRYHGDRTDSKYEQTKNSFVIRLGKFCGKPYVVDDIKHAKNSEGHPVATHTIYKETNEVFGWIKCEVLKKQETREKVSSVAKQRDILKKQAEDQITQKSTIKRNFTVEKLSKKLNVSVVVIEDICKKYDFEKNPNELIDIRNVLSIVNIVIGEDITLDSLSNELGCTVQDIFDFAREENIAIAKDELTVSQEIAGIIREYIDV